MSHSTFSYSIDHLRNLVSHTLDEAVQQGASAAEVDVSESVGQSVTVRLGEVETIEYNRDKGVGITIYLGQQKGHASTSDLSAAALSDTVRAALAIARHTAVDDCAGLADRDRLATQFPDLDLFHPWALPVEDAIVLAQECEAAARAVDSRISNSEGASVSSHASQFVYGNSHGFLGDTISTRHSLSCAVIAESAGSMQRDYWYSVSRRSSELETAASVGQAAGQRTLARLDSRRVKTGQYPVLFDRTVASGLIGNWVSAVSGGSLYRKATFLHDSLGQQVFSDCVTIEERPFLPAGLASSNFDAEGVATCDRTLVDCGVQQGYFLGSYSARKLGMQSTGNAGGNHNLRVPGSGASFDDLLKAMGSGLLVTELLGHGLNLITGDYSRGAAGFWVENGVIQYPVEELTIAGNLRDMFKDIIGIGDDVLLRGSKQVGSILVRRMTVAGQ